MRAFTPPFRILIAGALALSLAGPAVSAVSAGPAEEGAARAEFERALAKGERLLEEWKFRDALPQLQRAVELADGPCGECLVGLARAYAGSGDHPRAVETIREALPLLSSPDLRTRAYTQLGLSLLEDRATQAEGEEALRQADELGGDGASLARYRLATMLFDRDRFPEALEFARRYLEDQPDGRAAVDLRRQLCRTRAERGLGPAGPDGEAVEPVPLTWRILRPEPVYTPSPPCSKRVRASGSQGLVQVVIDEDGCVQEVRIVRGLDARTDRNVLATVRDWLFRPALLEGEPVPVIHDLTVSF